MRINVKEWPWNVAYLLHYQVYHNPVLAEQFAEQLYFPGLVDVLQTELSKEDCDIFLVRYRSIQPTAITYTRKLIEKIATIPNLERMMGQPAQGHILQQQTYLFFQELFDKPLLETDFPERIAHHLLVTYIQIDPSTGYQPIIQTVWDLVQFSKRDLSKLHGVGERSLRAIERWLDQNGLAFNQQDQFQSVQYITPPIIPRTYQHLVTLTPEHTLYIKGEKENE